jgi:predicted deacylase
MTAPAPVPIAIATGAGVVPGLADFDVEVPPPDLQAWRAGNVGLAGVISHAGPRPGPHVALVSLIHGNEYAGAIVIDRLLRDGLRPLCGRLTCIFANLDAFSQFDPAQPTASRFIDEDLNRVWDLDVLEGPRVSAELDRARTLRPLIDTVDILLDLHSMLWPSEPLMLCGMTAKGRSLARRIGLPGLIIADAGHSSGRRLMDYGAFADPASHRSANLIEAGQHWLSGSVAITQAAVAALLHETGLLPLPAGRPAMPVPRLADVTHTINAATAGFAFVRQFRGGEVIAERNTLIAVDGLAEIRTPYDDCLLVMPSLRPSRGHTAVRLARFG